MVNRTNLALLPAIGALIGALAGFLHGAPDVGIWLPLHAAFSGFLLQAATISSTAALVLALCGLGAATMLRRRHGIEPPRLEHWSGAFLPVWRTLAPAAHFFGAAFCLLYASRYTPAGGKIVPIGFAVAHLVLLAASVWFLVHGVRGASPDRRLVVAYVVSTMAAVVIPLALRLQFWGHLGPLLDACLYTLLGGVAVLGYARFKRRVDSLPDKATDTPTARGNPELIVVEAAGLLLTTLALLAYLMSSQFDTRPTSAFTHILFVLLALAYLTGVVSTDARYELTRRLYRLVCPALIAVEVLVLVTLHARDEADPILIMSVVVVPLTGIAALLGIVWVGKDR